MLCAGVIHLIDLEEFICLGMIWLGGFYEVKTDGLYKGIVSNIIESSCRCFLIFVTSFDCDKL
jgi:hypothetical protein